jgi:hypothetical protein
MIKDFIPYLDLSINISKFEIFKIYKISNESILLQRIMFYINITI